MPVAAIGAVIGGLGFFAAGGTIAAGLTVFGMTLGLMQCVMIGASLASLFVSNSMDLSAGTTPNYTFGPRSNTKSQLLPIPIVYGRCKVAGNIFLQRFYDDDKQVMDIFVGVSEGEVARIYDVYADEHNLTDPFYGKQVTYQKSTSEEYETTDNKGNKVTRYRTVWVDITRSEYLELKRKEDDPGGPFPSIPGSMVRVIGSDGSTLETDLEDCYVNVHTGAASQAADPLSLGGLPYNNTAYVAVHLKAQEGLSGSPTITSMVDGVKIRTSKESKDKSFSRNPAWIVFDFLTNRRYGLGIPERYIDIDAIESVALYCDTLVEDEPRYLLDLIIDAQRPGIDHLNDMLACFGGYFVCDSKIRLCVEKAETVSFELTADGIVQNSFQWWQKALDETYNRVTVVWIDPAEDYESVTSVYQDEADIEARGIVEQSYTMRGITRKQQADRIGTDMLNKSRRCTNMCSFGIGIKDSSIEIGEVGRVKFPRYTGWENKLVRVVSMQEDGNGEIRLSCLEYDGDIYDGPVIDGGTTDNYPIRASADITDLVLSSSGHTEPDGTWIPGVYAAWRPPTEWACIKIIVSYRLADEQGEGPPVFSGAYTELSPLRGDATDVTIEGGIKAQYYVDVMVQGVKADGSRSAGVNDLCYVDKDTEAPDAPTSLTAEGWFGNIILNWVNPQDYDYSHTEIWENAADDRDKAVLVGVLRGNCYTRHTGSFQGRYYWVRAVDYSGNYSLWNAEAGTFGYSEQEKHDDVIEYLLRKNPWIQDEFTNMQKGITLEIENLAETILSSDATLSDHTDDLKKGIAIAREELSTRIEEGLLAEALRRLELAAALNDATAAIQEEQIARVTADGALARDITTMAATVGDNTAAIQNEQSARVTADEAIAGNIETLVTTVGDNTAAIQESKQSIDGIKGKWAVKVDVNGKVAGMELIGTGQSSAMIFNVDTFIVGDANESPFVIAKVDGQWRVSIRNAYIQDAAISTLKIEHDAVTVYAFTTGGGTSGWQNYYGNNIRWYPVPNTPKFAVTEVVAGRPAMITLNVNWYSAEDYAGTSFRIVASQINYSIGNGCTNTALVDALLANSTMVWSKNCGGADQSNMSYSEQFEWRPPANGTWYIYTLWLLGSGGDYNCKWGTYLRSHSVSMLHMKR